MTSVVYMLCGCEVALVDPRLQKVPPFKHREEDHELSRQVPNSGASPPGAVTRSARPASAVRPPPMTDAYQRERIQQRLRARSARERYQEVCRIEHAAPGSVVGERS